MSIFDFQNRFWQECFKEPFSVSEVALYFYLVNEANHQRWEMPIRCNTQTMSFHLKTSRQTIINARAVLEQRKMIAFENGLSNPVNPLVAYLFKNEMLKYDFGNIACKKCAK